MRRPTLKALVQQGHTRDQARDILRSQSRSILRIGPDDIGVACDWAEERGLLRPGLRHVCRLRYVPITIRQALLARLPSARSRRRNGRPDTIETVLFAVEDIQAVFGFASANRPNYVRPLKRRREVHIMPTL